MTQQLFSLPISIPFKRIYSRLGQRVSTQIDDNTKSKIDNLINEAFLLCEPKARCEIFRVEQNDGKNIVIGGETFVSESFCELVKNCDRIALFAVTIGEKLMQRRQEFIDKGDMFNAVVYDAAASELAEEAAEYMHGFLGKMAATTGGVIMKRRFSPGYSDMSLEMQKKIFKLLKPENIGIHLSPSCLMIPEKSVTAFVGIENG
jgi:cobalamin-dependent methionine synthase I